MMPKSQDGTARGWSPFWWVRDLLIWTTLPVVLLTVAACSAKDNFVQGDPVTATVQLIGTNCYVVISFDHLVVEGNMSASLIRSDCEKVRKRQEELNHE